MTEALEDITRTSREHEEKGRSITRRQFMIGSLGAVGTAFLAAVGLNKCTSVSYGADKAAQVEAANTSADFVKDVNLTPAELEQKKNIEYKIVPDRSTDPTLWHLHAIDKTTQQSIWVTDKSIEIDDRCQPTLSKDGIVYAVSYARGGSMVTLF